MNNLHKAQTWSLEVIISLSIFLVLFLGIVLVFFQSPPSTQPAVDVQSIPLMSRFNINAQNQTGAFLDGNVVNQERLEELRMQNYSQLKEDLAITDDFCIVFTDENGEVIPLNGSQGIGYSNITINGISCS